MKITVELSDADLEDVCRFSGEAKKGPAIRKVLLEALMLKRRQEMVRKFVSGEWGAELGGFEESEAADREEAEELERQWRS